MTDERAMAAALKDIDGLFHVAAVFDVSSMSASELLSVNIRGVEAVMRAAAASRVRRVLLTSTAAAVGTSSSARELRSENEWNDATKEPYALSKTRAERRGWALAAELHLPLITVLPGAMLGPGFNRLTPSLSLVADGLANRFPMAPPIDFAFTDVRDVADVHVRLYESAKAEGRYLASGPTRSVLQLLECIKREHPATAIPTEMPIWFARIFPVIDAIQHLLTRQPRRMRRGFVAEYVGRHHALSTEKLAREVGWNPRPLEHTLRDTIAWMQGVRAEQLLE
jgi:dihydroflavonol-4-reductase